MVTKIKQLGSNLLLVDTYKWTKLDYVMYNFVGVVLLITVVWLFLLVSVIVLFIV